MENKYSFQEFDNEIRDSYLRTSLVFDERNKLRDNWNSLREWIKENSWYYNTSDGCQWVDQFKLLDKMNELEGKDKE